MKIYNSLINLRDYDGAQGLVLTIGIFDGLHCGHQKLLRFVKKIAKASKMISAVMTFQPHPLKILNRLNYPPLLISVEHRLNLIEQFGIDVCFVIKFTRRFSKITPERFIEDFLIKRLNVRYLVVGEDFNFAKDKKGTVQFLKKIENANRLKMYVLSSVKYSQKKISSTRIRHLIEKGKLGIAAKLLGRPVSVLGTVISGSGRGKKLGFPTANIDPHHEAIPPSGVYVVKLKYENKFYRAMLNIGQRPTFSCKNNVIEVHIFNFKRNIYGENIEIFFLKKLRDERKFKNLNYLKRQLARDKIKTQNYIKSRQFGLNLQRVC
ncbi:MAG: bifunctional riboflavin kinase/FAD synthetase [Candidatus Omnitrophota bacterium]